MSILYLLIVYSSERAHTPWSFGRVDWLLLLYEKCVDYDAAAAVRTWQALCNAGWWAYATAAAAAVRPYTSSVLVEAQQ